MRELPTHPRDRVTRFIAYCDGGSRGNPGPAAFGVSIEDMDGNEVEAIGEKIGRDTNNVAEYRAVITALQRCAELGATEVEIRTDSQLLVRQLEGAYKVKAPHLKPLHDEARTAARAIGTVVFTHVYREQNVRADALVNEALDGLR